MKTTLRPKSTLNQLFTRKKDPLNSTEYRRKTIGIPEVVAKWEIFKDNPDWKQVFLKLKATTTDPRLI